jgi:hypothetical protein
LPVAIVATGRYRRSGNDWTIAFDGDVDATVHATAAAHTRLGLALLESLGERLALRETLAILADMRVEIVAEHEHALDVDIERKTIGIDSGVVSALRLSASAGRVTAPALEYEARGQLRRIERDEVVGGFALLSALGHVYAAARARGRDERAALHAVLDLFAALRARHEVSALLKLLFAPHLDSGNAFGLFLRSVVDADLAKEIEGVDIAALLGKTEAELFEIGSSAAATSESPATASAALKWRDKWVTWILGQNFVDVPYDQEASFELLAEREGEDIDERRRAVHVELATTYDRETEGANIERLSHDLEGEGRMIVCGRISRAFGNQTQLLSAASHVDTTDLKAPVRAIVDAAKGIGDVETQITRLSKLVFQVRPVSHAELRGALWHLEEALSAHQAAATKKINARKEADHDKLVGRRGVEPFQAELEALLSRAVRLFALANEVRRALEGAPKRSAAFLILQQRFFPGETQLLALANANRDTHPGKIEQLRDLTRKGGHNRYASEGYGRVVDANGASRNTSWISKCQHWIEAIPMFIKERIVKVPVTVGGQTSIVERIETEVDQRGMEAFFRYAAQFWAENCNEVADSEHVAVAREIIAARVFPDEFGRMVRVEGKSEEEAARVLVAGHDLATLVGLVAALVARAAADRAEEVGTAVEKGELSRFEALRQTLLHNAAKKGPLAELVSRPRLGAKDMAEAAAPAVTSLGLDKEATRLGALASRRRRAISTLHILTTESAGMTEGYVQTWLETEMALYNVVKAHGWESEVAARVEHLRRRVEAVAEKVVAELGMEAVVQEAMSENNAPRAAALGMILATNRPVADEVARLIVLVEELERRTGAVQDPREPKEPAWVDERIAAHRERLVALAVPKVLEAGGHALKLAIDAYAAESAGDPLHAALAVIERDPDSAADLAFSVRSIARQETIAELDRQEPGLNLSMTQGECLRNYTQLALSFARRHVVASHGAQSLTESPLYNYRAARAKKRYNLLYTPSRVDLGAEEMDSIVRWNQWVGGADEAACHAGREFYSLINEAGVEVRPALAWQEIQKTSENANMTAGKAFANAVALLISSVGEGDQQLMADQMYLRHDPDRGTPAASEGYGGYCVPKDGLFLAFVLGLSNETKLRQMGIPPSMHAAVLSLAREAILHVGDFESDFDWQLWVAKKLLSHESLREHVSRYLGIREMKGEEILVFNVVKIAEAIQALGQPWHEVSEGDTLLGNLAARWAVEKMIVGAEQVQRFMVFYKAWTIARCLREAGREREGRVVTPAEYKTVQDIRYSGGIRIVEILAKTGEHLTSSLDEEGQNLVFLMMHGFTPLSEIDGEQAAIDRLPQGSEERARRQKIVDRRRRLAHLLYEVFRIDERSRGAPVDELRRKFPSLVPPADLRLVSSTMASTQDVFYYTDDTQLTQIADRAMQALSDVGLAEEQMRSSSEVYGGDLASWPGIKQMADERRRALLESSIVYRVGADTFEVPLKGAIHALVLRLRGPGRAYEREVQGADVLNTSIAFRELFDLVDDPPKLVALMLEGNPNSALAITDSISGRGSRMLTYQDVMMFFATCEAMTGASRGIYRAIGLGDRVVGRLRHEMVSKRRRTQEVLDALLAVGRATGREARDEAVLVASRVFERVRLAVARADEAAESISEEERSLRYKRHKVRDRHVTRALARVAAGLDLGRLDFGTWLALGGMYVVAAQSKTRVEALRTAFERAVALVPKAPEEPALAPPTKEEIDEAIASLVRTRFVPASQKFEQVLGRESSSKAVHAGETEARERRKALRARQLRIEIFNLRQRGFAETLPMVEGRGLDRAHEEGKKVLDTMLERVSALFAMPHAQATDARREINVLVGRFLACASRGIAGAVEELYPAGDDRLRRQKERFLKNLSALYTGREVVLESWKKIAGGYEDMGDFARLVQALGDDRGKLERLTLAIELFYTTLALSQTVEHVQVEAENVSWVRFWDDLAVFFAETLNDHDSYYWPWNYLRGVEKGVGFDRMSETELYALAARRHEWVHRYVRLLLTRHSEMRLLPAHEQDVLLGNALDGKDIAAIGAGGASREERTWRAYNQLREMAFLRNDSFPVPVVFPELDPGIVEADRRVNIVFLFPVGRTHVSRAFREAPTLSRELAREGRPGVNIILARYGELAPTTGATRKVLSCTSGHLYLSRAELVAALVRAKGMTEAGAEETARGLEASGALTPKGIRAAVRFSKPVVAGSVVPYHGNALYTSGALEDAGFPYTVQSLVHTDISYDKSLYPDVYRSSGVEMPPEIDWLTSYQEGLGRAEAVHQIVEGREGYAGLRRFSENHPLVLIKGAAESGARNLKVFEIGKGKGAWNEDELAAAAVFVYERAVKQNMVIQEAARTTPEFWASPAYMTNFVDRQIVEWGVAVHRDRLPRSQIYGSLRIIACSSGPDRPYDLTHLIALASLQVATNVGRGGTLEPLKEVFIQETHREAIRKGLSDQVPLVMKALDRYAPQFEKTFRARRGRAIGADLRGVSYGWPGYMMLDYLVTPVFEREGRLVDIEPVFDSAGQRLPSRIVLEDGVGRFEGKIVSWRFVHLEPNVGIGLWDRYSLREEEWEARAASAEGRAFDWDAVGRDDRIVLRNFAIAGHQYLDANFGGSYFGR